MLFRSDVHGPVGAAILAELPGAVERIDDPDPFAFEPDRIVLRLFGEDGVVGAGGPECGQDPFVGGGVRLFLTRTISFRPEFRYAYSEGFRTVRTAAALGYQW